MKNRRARRWLGVVGLLVIALGITAWLRMGSNVVEVGLPAGEDGETVAAMGAVELTLLTYNVQCRPWLDDIDEKLPKIAAQLDGYDVVTLQECFSGYAHVAQGTDYPNRFYFNRLVYPWKVVNSGLATLTALPVRDVVFMHYGNSGEFQDHLASKGMLLTRLNAARHTIDIYNTHMEAGHSPGAQATRMKQAHQVVEFVRRNSPPAHSVIITGDFNMGPHREGKAWQDYAPNHYASQRDMEQRTAAFMVMFEGLGLRDANDELRGPDDEIERYLYRPGTGYTLTPLDMQRERLRRDDGTSLSDGSPTVMRFRLAPAGEDTPQVNLAAAVPRG